MAQLETKMKEEQNTKMANNAASGSSRGLQERLGIAGSGTIACGLAATVSGIADVLLWARSASSAERARATVSRTCAKYAQDGLDAARVTIVTDPAELATATFVVEAVSEDYATKASVLARLARLDASEASPALFATTTSSLSVQHLARSSGVSDRLVGLHLFNPVPRMKLVELVFPEGVAGVTRARVHNVCDLLGKTSVEVPDIPGFIVNRLLFPYLFRAVELMSETGLSAEAIDQCMTLGTGAPMGPIALLDFIGLDVSQAIGEAIGSEVPPALLALVRSGALGRKSGGGFYPAA